MNCPKDLEDPADLAILVLRSPHKHSSRNRLECQAAVGNMLRRCLINEGFFDLSKPLRSGVENPKAGVYAICVEADTCTVKVRSDFETGLCFVSIWHPDWTVERLIDVRALAECLVAIGLASRISCATLPSRLWSRIEREVSASQDEAAIPDTLPRILAVSAAS